MSVHLRSLVDLNSDGTPFDVEVPRNRILDLFPDSLLATILQVDPNVEVIEIPSPEVNKNHLTALKYILDHGDLPNVNLSRVDPSYVRASNYLGIDILSVLADPTLPDLRRYYSDVNLVTLDQTHYDTVINYAFRTNAPYLGWYIMRNVINYSG